MDITVIFFYDYKFEWMKNVLQMKNSSILYVRPLIKKRLEHKE
jgi:hypothetical protein